MMGRESAREGAFKPSAYVAAEFRRLGLEPVGDKGTYFQTVPFSVVAADPQSRLVTSSGATLRLVTDFLPVSAPLPPQGLAPQTPILFSGTGAGTRQLVAADPALARKSVWRPRLHHQVGFIVSPVIPDPLGPFTRGGRRRAADSPIPRGPSDEETKTGSILNSLRAVNRPRPDSIRNGADDD